jgi:hypothetical protein
MIYGCVCVFDTKTAWVDGYNKMKATAKIVPNHTANNK